MKRQIVYLRKKNKIFAILSMQFVSPGQNNNNNNNKNNNLFEKNLLALSPMCLGLQASLPCKKNLPVTLRDNRSTSIYSHKLLINYNLRCENTIHVIFMV
ncbi:hypothetical protein Peur_028280 [Populus x canadensis]